MIINLNIDGQVHTADIEDSTPLLWTLRDHLNLTGTKYGCGVGQCGACTVLVDGQATRSCSIKASELKDTKITTIANTQNKVLRIVQESWIEHDVVQCGYCQSGQIMNATGLLMDNPFPTEDQIIESMNGNICRCGTYNRIKTAIKEIAIQGL
jgi:isoquinoline 1-oxidoreductase alpha subunit